ncbi:hypothetical protein OROMI_018336 [Orobanche minor]
MVFHILLMKNQGTLFNLRVCGGRAKPVDTRRFEVDVQPASAGDSR